VNGNTGASTGTTESTGGKIANARYSDGTDNYIQIPAAASINNLFAGGGTFEAWIRPATYGENVPDGGRIGDKSSSTTANMGWGFGTFQSLNLSFRKGFTTTDGHWCTPIGSISLNIYQHVVVTYDNSSSANNPTIYINGTSQTIKRMTAPSGNPESDSASNMRIFNIVSATTRDYNRDIDEVRASKTVRSASWILTEYNNQNSPSTFISVGTEKSSPCGLGPGPWYVQSAGIHYSGGSSGTVTLPYSTTAGRLLVVSVIFDSTTLNVASVSDSVNGAVYNLALAPTTVASGWKMYTYYVNNSAAGGPITATVTLSGGTSSILDIFLTEYGGIALALPLDQTSAGTGTGTSMNSGSATTTTASEMIYGFGADDWDCHGTAPYIDRETTDAMCVMDRNVTATGSYSVAATQSQSGNWGLQMVTFKGA
jgi:hypothetical protein